LPQQQPFKCVEHVVHLPEIIKQRGIVWWRRLSVPVGAELVENRAETALAVDQSQICGP
jgi:hypothetical protein